MLQTLTFLFLTSTSLVQSICHKGCDLALASYYIVPAGNDINSISKFINTSPTNILKYNPNTTFRPFTRINLPFRCDCIAHEFLGHVFNYVLTSVDIYETIAQERYANLTTADWIQRFNYYDPNRVPDGSNVNVTVNCSCGDGSVSREYGLFLTYPLRPGETLDSVSWAANLSSELIRSYNPDANFSQGSGLVYIPWRAQVTQPLH
ncbi:putative non-specific serine/threonine protein kinase [Helianthus annuus]|nr:putative non-specific serine/threonine protein kinase [Helianthus annuus]